MNLILESIYESIRTLKQIKDCRLDILHNHLTIIEKKEADGIIEAQDKIAEIIKHLETQYRKEQIKLLRNDIKFKEQELKELVDKYE